MTSQPTHAIDPWPIRSLLYVPATRPEWVIKAINTETEAVILDLEDSVAPTDKERARSLVAEEIETLHSHGVAAFVRPNQLLAGGVDDIHACVRPGLTGIILPGPRVPAIHANTVTYLDGAVPTEQVSELA